VITKLELLFAVQVSIWQEHDRVAFDEYFIAWKFEIGGYGRVALFTPSPDGTFRQPLALAEASARASSASPAMESSITLNSVGESGVAA